MINKAILGIMAVMLAFMVGCSTSRNVQTGGTNYYLSNAQAYQAAADTSYRIRPGDEVNIVVRRHANFDTTATVSLQGNIIVPLIGKIQASGKTKQQLKRVLKRKLSIYIKGNVTLMIVIRRTSREQVSVLGRVGHPNIYQIPDTISIFKMLAIAGGPTADAKITKVRIYHKYGKHKYHVLNLKHYLKRQEVQEAPKVYPGDIIYVPVKRFTFTIRDILRIVRDGLVVYGIIRAIGK
jgi:polysaccharide export outer membrane protein